MNILRSIRILAAGLGLCLAMQAPAQALSFDDLWSGSKYPTTIKTSDLTPEYKAFKLTMAAGSGGASDMMSAYMPLMMLGSRGSETTGADLFMVLGTYWTTGKMVKFNGQEYLVTYKLEMDLTSAAKPTAKAVSLKLNFVRTDLIATITPETTITKERIEKDLAETGANAATEQPLTQPASPEPATNGRQQDLANVKQVATGLIMYQSDNDETLPYVQSTGAAVEVTAPYLKSTGLWWTSDGHRLLFNMRLAGVMSAEIAKPAETILVYADKPSADGTRVVGFADGHAKRVSAAEFSNLEPSLYEKFPKQGRPLPAALGKQYNTAYPPTKKGSG